MNIEKISQEVGLVIRARRNRHGLTQDELAKRADVGTATVTRIEGGSVSRSNFETVAKLADALGLQLSAVIEEAERGASGSLGGGA